MPEASATPAAAPPELSTAALIQQITAEARSSGQSLVYNPDAPDTADGDDGGTAPGKPKREATTPNDHEDAEESPEDDAEVDPTDEDGGESTEPRGEINAEAVKAALSGEDGVDMLALAEALGVDPEKLKVTAAQHRVLRLQQKKARDMAQKAHDISKRLQTEYGDQVRARKAVAEGDLNPAIEFIEGTFGMSWNELNRMVGQLLQGKPVKDIEAKRELQQLRKKEAERVEAEKKSLETKATESKVADAKAWIASSIKGDKLSTPELNKQLAEAGFPTITDLVFEEMQANYSKGLTDPRKALERVKLKLAKQARALQSAGLGGKPAPAKPRPMATAKPRASAQTGAAGNGRPMTDSELRQAVLKEAGLWR